MVVAVRLCFGLDITDHIHDPVQIKGSVKKKSAGGGGIFNPQAEKEQNLIQEM